ncbi:leucine-rich repeat (LRR) family protein [Actinidia rufa]|uniref:Leucine-rich repeat (LRR) family protein n=1 Tax=Actinidia rufa TaxID=165716 RepID=A0A7J0H3T7_9ERIC|nr:leucine-rich repeat (LRR) family protein [Actinidia rufa]
MTVLSSKKVLKDKQTRDTDAITALDLNHKALTDVSCLSEFKNLERLDISSNNLTSLEGLKLCVNLKWLSVVQNKIQSLRGIEGLTKLTVLNAGKNKLKSLDEVMTLISLRALILNDNEIVSICRLDQMKELNTLVLSRNPIPKVGESLVKMKSITKLSLSNCQLQTIDSLKSCTELKELRLAHNDIKTLPTELVHNLKLQLLDVGNNLITSWSDLKVLSSLVNLKNLNVQGNPIAEKDNLARKIRKLVPNLQIFNARPMDKSTRNEKGDRDEIVDKKRGAQNEEKIDHIIRNKNLKHYVMNESNDNQHDNARDVDKEGGLKLKNKKIMPLRKEKDSDKKETNNIVDKKLKKKLKVQENEINVLGDEETQFADPSVKKELKRKKDKTSQILKVEAAKHNDESTITEKELKRKSKRAKQNETAVIDDNETPFTDLFTLAGENIENSGGRMEARAVQDVDAISGLVTFPVKKKKIKSRDKSSALQFSSTAEVGLGGQSTWDD